MVTLVISVILRTSTQNLTLDPTATPVVTYARIEAQTDLYCHVIGLVTHFQQHTNRFVCGHDTQSRGMEADVEEQYCNEGIEFHLILQLHQLGQHTRVGHSCPDCRLVRREAAEGT